MSWLKTEGRFPAVVLHNHKWLRESATGTPFLLLPVEITGDVCRGEKSELKLYFSPAAFDKSCEKVEKAFPEFKPFSDLYGLDEGRISFEGRPCRVEGKFEEYQGRQNFKCELLGGESVAISEGKLAQLDAMAKARAAGILQSEKPIELADEGEASVLPF